jgi:uncharacterized membrane protein YgdD (TMEM256/DUF423 family)
MIGAAMGFLAVALGAFGAHALRTRIPADRLDVYKTGVQYHMIHALGLLAVAVFAVRFNSGLLTVAGWLFTVGIILFSGSLYLLSVSNKRWLGAVTPIGGLAFLVGWVCIFLAGATAV